MLSGRSLASVLLGLGTLFGLLVALWRIQVALPPPSQMPGPVTVVLGALLVGLLSQVPAGYVTGRTARDRPIVHACVVASVGAVVVGAFVAQRGSTPFVWGLALGALQTPAILLGAWLADRYHGPQIR